MKGCLFLLPVNIGDNKAQDELAPIVINSIRSLKHFIVENEKTSRRFLSTIMNGEDLDNSSFYLLNEHTKASELPYLLVALEKGLNVGLLSEAGSPCIADPGSDLVAMASRAGIMVKAMPGPSSILLALMASGLNGQRFSFNGYLPPDREGREKAMRFLEKKSIKEKSTEIFIETPYRNTAIKESAVKVLKADTILCAAIGLLTKDELIIRKTIAEWRSTDLPRKIPCVFLLAGGSGQINT